MPARLGYHARMPTAPSPLPTNASASALLRLAGLAGFVLSVVLLYPGQYPFDAAYQWWQARTGHYSNITPVAMPAVWSVLLAATANPASLLVLNLALFWSGLVFAIERLPLACAWRLVALLATGLAPTTWVQLAHLLSDSHLAGVLMLACGLLVRAGDGRRWPLGIAAFLLVYAGCIRHNALLATIPLAVAFAVTVGAQGRLRQAGAAFAFVAASLFAAHLLDRSLAVERRELWPMLALWDLAAVSVATGNLHLPEYTHGPALSVDELRETRAFDPTSAAPLFARSRSGVASGLEKPYPPQQLADLRARWWSVATSHPGAWFAHRMRTFWMLVGPHRGEAQGVAFYVDRHRYRDNPELPSAIAPEWQASLYRLATRLVPGWPASALPWLALHAACGVLAWRRRATATGRVAVALASSALLYAAGFLVLAPSAELRYLTWPIVSAPLALVLALAAGRTAASGRAGATT